MSFFSLFDREVEKSMNNVKELYEKWNSLLNNPAMVGREEYNLTTSELKNSIRSIEWDLEGLEETIQIVEGNQRKFNLNPIEIGNRKEFVKQTKGSLNEIKVLVNSPIAQSKVQASNRRVSNREMNLRRCSATEAYRGHQRFLRLCCLLKILSLAWLVSLVT